MIFDSFMLSKQQNNFIDISLKVDKVRSCLSSRKEWAFRQLLNEIGLKEDDDYKHQFGLHNNDTVIVVDFCLLNQKIVVEIDGPRS